MTAVLSLAVPYDEKDLAKALGARWDGGARTWYVPVGRDPGPFSRWLRHEIPEPPFVGGVEAEVVAMATDCWRCRMAIRVVVGVTVAPPDYPPAFVWFDDVSAWLARQLDHRALAQHERIGRVTFRRSRPCPEGYLANTCVHCDALQGSFPIREEFKEYLAEGGDPRRLPVVATVELPVSVLADAEPLESTAEAANLYA